MTASLNWILCGFFESTGKNKSQRQSFGTKSKMTCLTIERTEGSRVVCHRSGYGPVLESQIKTRCVLVGEAECWLPTLEIHCRLRIFNTIQVCLLEKKGYKVQPAGPRGPPQLRRQGLGAAALLLQPPPLAALFLAGFFPESTLAPACLLLPRSFEMWRRFIATAQVLNHPGRLVSVSSEQQRCPPTLGTRGPESVKHGAAGIIGPGCSGSL